jgi:hypothetical protein
LFSDLGGVHVKPFGFFASSSDRVGTYLALRERGMLDFFPASAFSPAAVIDLFGVEKGPDSLRLIADMRPGNSCFKPMSAMQGVYEQYLLPFGGASAVGLPHTAFELFTPSDLHRLPPGVLAKGVSDLSNFFHFSVCRSG